MPTPATSESTDTRPFLRTGPESALHSDVSSPSGVEPVPPGDDAPIFPAPELPGEIHRQLDLWERFTALAVHLDAPVGPASDKGCPDILEAALEETCRSRSGLWFKWDTHLYGCALPEIEHRHAGALAREVQTHLGEQRVETISIGISHFPLLDYDRATILHNACKALDHAAFFGPGSVVAFDAVSLNISGDHFYQNGDLDRAVAEYQAALRLDPGDVNIHNSLGVCRAQQQDHQGARAAFQEASRLAPDEAMALFNLGMLDALEKNPDRAMDYFRQAYALDPDTFEIPFQMGKLLTERNEYEQAATYLATAIKLRDTHAPAFTLLGQCLMSLDRAPEAIQAYKKAVKLNPNDAAALSALGMLYDRRGENPDICLTFCRQSVSLCPDDGLFRWRLARIYHKHDQLEAALAEYKAAAELGQDAGAQIAELQEQLAAGDPRQCCA